MARLHQTHAGRHGNLRADGAASRQGRLAVGASGRNESPIGTIFGGRIEDAVRIGSIDGIRPSLGARITGHNTVFVDDRDPDSRLPDGGGMRMVSR
ncbi:proline racemase family protein [Paenirhodobacter populi]|uniref:proline racemase family protein n=1 Tax=Paenirhodobacter populi TaxID=2306993 RepID=UPI0019D41611|nr:proline racemase family protein [Sinirhodobacter populi]